MTAGTPWRTTPSNTHSVHPITIPRKTKVKKQTGGKHSFAERYFFSLGRSDMARTTCEVVIALACVDSFSRTPGMTWHYDCSCLCERFFALRWLSVRHGITSALRLFLLACLCERFSRHAMAHHTVQHPLSTPNCNPLGNYKRQTGGNTHPSENPSWPRSADSRLALCWLSAGSPLAPSLPTSTLLAPLLAPYWPPTGP